MVAALSLSVKFVVNVTQDTSDKDVYECLANGNCVVGCDLNMTIPLSAALGIHNGPLLKGLINSITVSSIQIISSKVDIDLTSLTSIFNTLIGSFRPQINKSIQEGIELDISPLSKYKIVDLLMSIKKDHLFLGVNLS